MLPAIEISGVSTSMPSRVEKYSRMSRSKRARALSAGRAAVGRQFSVGFMAGVAYVQLQVDDCQSQNFVFKISKYVL